MRIPRVWAILFATGQALAIKRFSFRISLLAAERAGQRAQGDIHVLGRSVLAPKRECLAKGGFGLSQVALVEESVAAAEKVRVGITTHLDRPTKNLEGLAAGNVRLGLLTFER